MHAESRVITQYTAHDYTSKGTQLIFPDPKEMAILSVWMEMEAHQFDPLASKLCDGCVAHPHLDH